MSGDALADVVAVIDRLVSPGGCPWDAEQTHASLAPYLIEEAYEVVDAIEGGAVDGRATGGGAVDGRATGGGAVEEAADAHLAEELGDVLLQVVFHARLAAGRGAFDIDDVARGLLAKLIRRHPHVFEVAADAAGAGATAESVALSWEQLKSTEKPDRGLFEGIPAGLPALARADKVAGRLQRAGLGPAAVGVPAEDAAADDLGRQLFALVVAARQEGIDAEAALRGVLRRIEENAGEPGPFAHGQREVRPSRADARAH